jgi:AraC-like DNA-binding protein
MRAGDFTLCDSAAPQSYALEEDSEIVVLRLAANLLKEHLPSPEYFCGRHLPASVGLTPTAAAMAASLVRLAEAGLPADYQVRIVRNLLDILATCYAIAFDTLISGSAILSGRHAKVKLCIEQHLRNPELSPSWIARQLKVSSRYLRMIFATSNETVSAYILRRRLEESARQMADARWRGHSITEIAFAWGFNSASHFTRSFRDRYEVSPRDYRRARLDSLETNARQAPPAAANEPPVLAMAS